MELLLDVLVCLAAASLLLGWARILFGRRTKRRGRKTQLVGVARAESSFGGGDDAMDEPNHCPRCGQEMAEEPPKICRRCRSDPFPADTFARIHGWKIKHRPKSGHDIWTDAPNIYAPGRECTIAEVLGEIEDAIRKGG